MRNLLLLILKAYRYLISPWLGSRCRFYPSCSEYASQAIMEQGAVKGTFLTVKRVARCHPWCDGGYDPVPKTNRT